MSCSYCFNTPEEKKIKVPSLDLEKVENAFMREDPCIVTIGGGEPFLLKDFVKICEIITKKHQLIIVTSLPHDVDPLNFCSTINPEKVLGVSVSLHYLYREGTYEYGEFCYNIELLKRHKFPYRVSQVMTPDIIDEFPFIQESFKSKIYPKVLEGSYKGKKYPAAYTTEESEKLLNIIRKANGDDLDVYMAEKILKGYSKENEINFTGKLCSSGYDDIVVVEGGTVYRCWNRLVPLGNFFENEVMWWDEPQECHYKWCSCPQMGFEDTEKLSHESSSCHFC